MFYSLSIDNRHGSRRVLQTISSNRGDDHQNIGVTIQYPQAADIKTWPTAFSLDEQVEEPFPCQLTGGPVVAGQPARPILAGTVARTRHRNRNGCLGLGRVVGSGQGGWRLEPVTSLKVRRKQAGWWKQQQVSNSIQTVQECSG